MIRWDEAKRAANLAKHGVDFAVATGFDWDGALVVEDTRFDYGERRYQALGNDRPAPLHAGLYADPGRFSGHQPA